MKQKEGFVSRILVPLAVVLSILLGVSVISIYRLQTQHLDQNVKAHLAQVSHLFPNLLSEEAKFMHGQLDFFMADETIQAPYLAGDREALLAYTQPVFEDIRNRYRVTHFYFIAADRQTFLRLHNPPRYGDYIDRVTLAQAAETKQPAEGIELGRFGTFTLRVVHPWYLEGELIGYLELGMEIEHLTPALKEVLNVELFFAIEKRFLTRTDWEEGLAMLGQTGDWDQFGDFVIIDRTLPLIPPELEAFLNHRHDTYHDSLFTVTTPTIDYRGGFVPLIDVGGRKVGDIIVLDNVTQAINDRQTLTLSLILISIIMGGGLWGFFYVYVNRIDDQLAKSQADLLTEIEERSHIEQQLRKLSSAVEQSSASVVITNLAGEIEYVNSSFTDITGYQPEEVIGQNPRVLKSGQHPAEFYKKLWDTINSGKEWQGELCNRRKNGDLFWEFGSLSPVRNKHGEITHFLAVKEDITERKQVQQELKKYRQQLEELVQERTAELTATNEQLQEEIKERKRVEAELRKHRRHLEDLVQERTHRLEIVASLSERFSTILQIEELLKQLVNQIKEQLGYYHAHIYLLDDSGEQLVVAEGTGEAGGEMKQNGYHIPLTRPHSVVARAARTKELVMVDDARKLPEWQPHPLLPESYAKIAVPIILQDQVAGVLVVHQNEVGGLDESDADLLRSLASHVAIDLANAQLFEQTQQALDETEKLYRISRQLVSANNLFQLVTAVANSIAVPVINRAILLVSEYNSAGQIEAFILKSSWYSGQGVSPRQVSRHYSLSEPTVVNLAMTLEPRYYHDVQQDERVPLEIRQEATNRHIHALIVLPLLTQGRQLGALLLLGEKPYHFTEAELRPYFSQVGQIAVAVENHLLLQETQQRAAELAEAKEELTRLNANKDKFFSIVAHDLRSPFMPLLGTAELLAELGDTLEATEVQEMGRSIHNSARNVFNLLENLLQWSRMQMGRLKYQPSLVQLRAVSRQTVNLLAANAAAKKITLQHQVPSDIMVEADENMLDTIIRNLTSNALKFTPTGGQVTISAHPNGEFVEVSVTDTGLGISQENINKLFKIEVHHSTVGTAKEQGTGLGLIMCQEMVAMHGGRIWITSELNEGTTVTFTIPGAAG